MYSIKRIFLILLFSTLKINDVFASDIFADSHIHYNWEHREETSTQEVVDILKQHNVGLTIVAGTPSELALELREKGGDWIIPFFSPYIHELGKRDWHKDEQVVKNAEQGLKSGQYYGIGEVPFYEWLSTKNRQQDFPSTAQAG